jgi:hypothetical protein
MPSVYDPPLMSEPNFHTHTRPKQNYAFLYFFLYVHISTHTQLLPNFLLNQIVICYYHSRSVMVPELIYSSIQVSDIPVLSVRCKLINFLFQLFFFFFFAFLIWDTIAAFMGHAVA